MLRLLRIEWGKLWPYRAFRVLFVLYFVLLIGSLLIGRNLRDDEGGIDTMLKIFDLPNIWNYYLYYACVFNVIPGILTIFILTNEYSYKTIRQNLIDGLSRRELYISKLALIIILTGLSTVTVYISGAIAGMLYNPGSSMGELFERNVLILGYAVQSLGVLSMAAFFAVLLKRSGLATILFLLFIFPLDVILNQALLRGCCSDYLPVSVYFVKIINSPWRMFRSFGADPQTALELVPVLVGISYILVFQVATWLLIKRRDL